jgi:hypothetical protein
MKRKGLGIQIGMVALAALFGGASPATAVERSVPVSQIPSKTDAVIPGKGAKPDKEKRAIVPIRGNGFGEDYLFPSVASSPIWFGKSQRKKHTSVVSIKRRVNKRHKAKA